VPAALAPVTFSDREALIADAMVVVALLAICRAWQRRR
jgi:hypothetical protein